MESGCAHGHLPKEIVYRSRSPKVTARMPRCLPSNSNYALPMAKLALSGNVEFFRKRSFGEHPPIDHRQYEKDASASGNCLPN
jgi:hypothetical protein